MKPPPSSCTWPLPGFTRYGRTCGPPPALGAVTNSTPLLGTPSRFPAATNAPPLKFSYAVTPAPKYGLCAPCTTVTHAVQVKDWPSVLVTVRSTDPSFAVSAAVTFTFADVLLSRLTESTVSPEFDGNVTVMPGE